MDRRSFLKFLGIGTAAAITNPTRYLRFNPETNIEDETEGDEYYNLEAINDSHLEMGLTFKPPIERRRFPRDAQEGDAVYDTMDNTLWVFDGTHWLSLLGPGAKNA